MEARYPSVCRVCGQTIHKGDRIGQREILSPRGKAPVKRYVHERCTDPTVTPVVTPEPESTTPTTPTPASGNPLVDAVQHIVDMRLSDRMDEVDARIQEQLEQLPAGGGYRLSITVSPPLTPKSEVTAPRHRDHALVCEMVGAGLPAFLVGPTGSGKSTMAQHVAEDLNLPFYDASCTETMSESKLVGRMAPNENGGCTFYTTDFLKSYEEGGLFLLDEVDACNPNVLIVLHSAIANGHLSLPHRPGAPVAKRHEKWRLILSGNTWGTGADAEYVGRNQLDKATLDRVALSTVYCGYDEELEAALCPNTELRAWALTVRAKIQQHKLRRTMSTRTLRAAHTMQAACNWTLQKVKDRYFTPWTPAERAKVEESV
jgi:cobaltochelatase CobS